MYTWRPRIHPHPTIIKKMKSFLEVEGKMGPIPVPVPSNQFRPPPPDINPNVRKDNVTEKRKRATHKKKFIPATPKPTAVCPPLLEAPSLKAKVRMQLVSLVQNPLLKEEPKIGEQSIISPKTEKCGWGPDCPFCKNQDKEDWDGKHQNQLQQKTSPQPKVQRPQRPQAKMPSKLTKA